MRRYREIECDDCGEFFSATKHTSCPNCKKDFKNARKYKRSNKSIRNSGTNDSTTTSLDGDDV